MAAIEIFYRFFLVLMNVGPTLQQAVFDCPLPWIPFGGSCYHFVFYPTKQYPEAKMSCMMDGAALASINTLAEHSFVSQWLMSNDPAINTWYTSGIINEENLKMRWEGDGTDIHPGFNLWLNNDHRDKSGDHIVYTYGVYEYLWSREYAMLSLPYICEISQYEAYKIVKEDRDFDFGSNYSDPVLAPRGPKFVIHQHSIVVVRSSTSLSAIIEYVATGKPQPIYTIIHRDYDGNITDMSNNQDNRHTVTSGKLTIHSPQEAEDSGIYYCMVQNEFGTVVSNPMTLSFGYLAEFSNVDPEPVTANNDDWAAIECVPPNHRPAVTYQWYKGNDHFIRPDLHPYMFISRNGRLYFSIVSLNDAGNYRCIVKLAAYNGAAIGTNQPPSRISLPIPLIVKNAAASVWGPRIQHMEIFPAIPKRGNTVYLECLAIGTMSLSYYWRREGLPMPPGAYMVDHSRVLVIPDSKVEDSGNYTCVVSRLNAQSVSKLLYLSIQADPFFLFKLKDQHIDIGSQLTWHCAARGIPTPSYSWLKNGVQLNTTEGDITVTSNVLVIHNADPVRHNGMYQCRAENKHGVAHTEGQLRVLGFSPTFAKRPVEEVVYGAIGGNASFTCHPDAAPYPTIKWLKNGVEMNLVAGDTNSRIILLANGNLLITNINNNDAGYYTCAVENVFGTASSSGQLTITGDVVINHPPFPVTVHLNETAFIRCQATASPGMDLVYRWNFNGHPLKLENDVHFTTGSSQLITGLFLRMAQHKHDGHYECIAKTPVDSASAGSTVSVIGPPGPIAYVYVETGTMTATTARLAWVLGDRYNNPILYYKIELSTEPYTNWTVHSQNLPEGDVMVPPDDTTKRIYQLNGLNPGTPHKFRVSAANIYGIGVPSLPSVIYQTLMAPPPRAPDNVGGGSGKVADLTITWDPLPEGDQGGPGIGYKVYWRIRGADRWLTTNLTGNKGEFVTQVGIDNFYRQYDVMVQPYNNFGDGPNSTIIVIYSAEDLPIVTVTGVSSYRYNSTAIMVTWAPVNNSREVMKGIIQGYQVNYWERYDPDPIVNAISWRTLDPHGLIIGLLPNTWYAYDVQVFNTAGLNSMGDTYFQRTTLNAPLLYPTEVTVNSHGFDSVYVNWRGIMTGSNEETLMGYKIKYWLNGDDITQAWEETTGRETHAILYGIAKGELYQLRLHGVSRGGDGNPGNIIYFTLGGQVTIDPSLSEIRAGTSCLASSCIMTVGLLIISTIFR